MSDSLTFTQPFWLFLLATLVPLVLLRLRCLRFRNLAIIALVAPRLRQNLLVGHGTGAHWGRFSLQLAGLTCLLLALAGPRYGSTQQESVSQGRNILIAIDTSRSMLASDLTPDRLTRAKLAAHDLVRALPADRIGLVAFAGSAFLQAPLTVDHEAVIESISQLDSTVIPRGGTNLGRAFKLAADTFKAAESNNNAFLIFTDGENLEGAEHLAKAKQLSEAADMKVITIGTGTIAGSIIPDPDSKTPGDFIRDRENNIVRSRLDPTTLKKLAHASGGLYLNLNSTAAMQNVVTAALDRLEKTVTEGRVIHKPIDRYRWALVPGILCLLLSLLPHRAVAAIHLPRITPAEHLSSSSSSSSSRLEPPAPQSTRTT